MRTRRTVQLCAAAVSLAALYTLEFSPLTSGPINAILFDRKHRTMWGGSRNHGEDYGIAR